MCGGAFEFEPGGEAESGGLLGLVGESGEAVRVEVGVGGPVADDFEPGIELAVVVEGCVGGAVPAGVDGVDVGLEVMVADVLESCGVFGGGEAAPGAEAEFAGLGFAVGLGGDVVAHEASEVCEGAFGVVSGVVAGPWDEEAGGEGDALVWLEEEFGVEEGGFGVESAVWESSEGGTPGA